MERVPEITGRRACSSVRVRQAGSGGHGASLLSGEQRAVLTYLRQIRRNDQTSRSASCSAADCPSVCPHQPCSLSHCQLGSQGKEAARTWGGEYREGGHPLAKLVIVVTGGKSRARRGHRYNIPLAIKTNSLKGNASDGEVNNVNEDCSPRRQCPPGLNVGSALASDGPRTSHLTSHFILICDIREVIVSAPSMHFTEFRSTLEGLGKYSRYG